MYLKPYLPKVDPVTGPKIQPQLRDAFANRLRIAEQPILKPVNADANPGSGLNVKLHEPFAEWFPSCFVLTNQNFPGCGFQMRSLAATLCDI